MKNVCEICKVEFETSKFAKTCSPRCRKIMSRQASVTGPGVTLEEKASVTPDFEFYTETIDRVSEAGKIEGEKDKIRTARYWYDVPISAKPIIKKGWPPMPDYMNGRQYFLWWKNNFKVGEGKDPFDGPVLHNPFPKYENVTYVPAGEGSRRWGTV